MTDAKIDELLAKRDNMLTRRDGLWSAKRVADIEAKLREVPAGQRPDVDAALGRIVKTLEKHAPPIGWFTSQAVTLEDDSVKALIEKTQRIWRETQEIEY